MAGAEWVRWAVAAMFATLTLFYLVRLCTPRQGGAVPPTETWTPRAA